MKSLYHIFHITILGFGLYSMPTLHAQTSPEDIEYTVGVGGEYFSNPGAEFVVAINPNISFPAVPAAAEFNALMYIPTSLVTGNEVFTVLDNATTGGQMNFQTSFAHTDGNTYFSFVYSGSGINLSTFGSGTFQLIFSVDVANGNGSAVWEIADQTSAIFTDFGIRSSLNVLGYNELVPTASVPLPVELISFEARAVGERSLLTWETANEQDNDYFSIERSTDGKYFEEIDVVSGAGNASVSLSYQAWDNKPLSGNNYYRLKQVDFNGDYDYSEIRVLNFKKKRYEVSVYPNPAVESIHIALEQVVEDGAVQIYDQLGRLVYQNNITNEEQLKTITVDHFPAGRYTVIIQVGIQKYSEKIIVQATD